MPYGPTSMIEETYAPPKRPNVSEAARKAAPARAAALNPDRRREIAQAGAAARWAGEGCLRVGRYP